MTRVVDWLPARPTSSELFNDIRLQLTTSLHIYTTTIFEGQQFTLGNKSPLSSTTTYASELTSSVEPVVLKKPHCYW